ncbi:mediator complex subunit MED14-domain-containing protein [Phakopsora pachyrhizi]|uniref:Mediator of RNA polymerase II transcription subunit 14 n=1 Tax=Phakopsora pachyrhizi TaxID=170000 RepID=A0AAV0AKL6_PHAPC|nr:mediator complex subunit MED14-domain-containing protein [Phakopsora pachyrhizi]CAH7667443.1 mediator complex subunit MED14-domain-containing protein [Phakopsora pachyrhizi]
MAATTGLNSNNSNNHHNHNHNHHQNYQQSQRQQSINNSHTEHQTNCQTNGHHPHNHPQNNHSKHHKQSSATIITSPSQNRPNPQSNLSKGKAKADQSQLTAQSDPNLNQQQISELDRVELGRHWGPHLVPLQFVIQRTIAQVFSELQGVAEISPTLDDFERKKRLIDYVIHSRRQIIKLLVLVKWSLNSSSVHKIMVSFDFLYYTIIRIVAFLQRQNQEFERTVNILRSSKENFYTARMRNYDIPTALQVLTNGYPTLPSQTLEQFQSKRPLSDERVIELMNELNELIRFRLVGSNEVLPKQFRSYRIGDGRVTFRVEKQFECSVTLGGGEEDSQWFLLHVEFLFRVTGPGGKDFSAIPQGPVRDQIIEMGNRLMTPGAPTELDPEPKPPERALMKLYAYLRDLCLNYQLEALLYQSTHLGRSAWAGHTKLSIPEDRSSLTVNYWAYVDHPPQPITRLAPTLQKRPPPPTSLRQGSITIQLKVERHSSTKTRILDFLNGYPIIQKDFNDEIEKDGDFGASYTKRLQVVWRPVELNQSLNATAPQTSSSFNQQPLKPIVSKTASKHTNKGQPLSSNWVGPRILESLMITEGNGIRFTNTRDGSIDVEIEIEELNLEKILMRTVRAHIDSQLRRSFKDLTLIERPLGASDSSPPVPYFKSVRLIPIDDRGIAQSIEVVLHGKHVVEVTIDRFSGRLRIQSKNCLGEQDSEGRPTTLGEDLSSNQSMLKSMAERVDDNIGGLRDMLILAKSNMLLDEIELNAQRFGIRTTRTIPIDRNQLNQSIISSPSSPLSNKAKTQSRLSPSSSTLRYEHVFKLRMYFKLNEDHYSMIMITQTGIKCNLIRIHKPNKSSTSSLNVEIPFFDEEEENEGSNRSYDRFSLRRSQLSYLYQFCTVQVMLNRLAKQLIKNRIAFKQILPLNKFIIKNPTDEKMMILNRSFEVLGLIVVPCKGCFKENLKRYLESNMAIRVSLIKVSHKPHIQLNKLPISKCEKICAVVDIIPF